MAVYQAHRLAIISAALTSAVAGCAATSEPAGPDRIAALSSALAAELVTIPAADPRRAAADEALAAIAALQAVPDRRAVFADVLAVPAPSAEPAEPAHLRLTALAPLGPLVAAAPPPDFALALGQFADRALAEGLWAELASLETAALTGLDPRIAPGADGAVRLMAGPVASRADAETRCYALTAWGLGCAPVELPSDARSLRGAS